MCSPQLYRRPSYGTPVHKLRYRAGRQRSTLQLCNAPPARKQLLRAWVGRSRRRSHAGRGGGPESYAPYLTRPPTALHGPRCGHAPARCASVREAAQPCRAQRKGGEPCAPRRARERARAGAMSDATKRNADAAGLGAEHAKRTRAEDASAGAEAELADTMRCHVAAAAADAPPHGAAALQLEAVTERAPAEAAGWAADAASAYDTATLGDAFSEAAILRRSWSEFERVEVSDSEALELRGGYGEVLKRRHVGAAADSYVAIKTLIHKADSDSGRQEEAELLKELLMYHRLGRPKDVEGWCPLITFLGLVPPCATSGRSYGLVLEWYGISLERVLKQPPASFDAAARRTVARHVALACCFLHDEAGPGNGQGIVHRDVKPSNVLVDDRWNPQTGACYNAKLADFGTARVLSLLANDGSKTMRKPSGTIQYMAPELLFLDGAAEAPKKVDVWSFGVLLYDLLSHLPFNRSGWYANDPRYLAAKERSPPRPKYLQEDLVTVLSTFYTLTSAVPELPATCNAPADLRRLQAACCNHEPAKRPSFREICAQLQRTRARLVLRYKPMVPLGAEALEVHASLHVADAAAPVDAHATLSEAHSDAAGEITVEFLVPVREGDTCSVELSPVGGAAYEWVGTATGTLGPPLPPLKAAPPGAPPLRAATLLVKPDWAACPAGGVRSALRLRWQRAAVAAEAAGADGAAGADKAPPMSLGALSLRMGMPAVRSLLPCSSLMRSSGRSDVFVSYRDTETGRASGTQFVLKLLLPGLRRAGFTVFCYAEQLHKGDAWVNVLTDGILASRAFIPVCSPTYADLYESPWGSNELAAAARAAAASGSGAPYIQPLWHSGAFPPPDTAALLTPLAARRVPAASVCGDEMVAAGKGEALVAELAEALKAAGISPSNAAS